MAKHKMVVFSVKGDQPVVEWEETDAASVEVARGAFEQAKADGWGAVTPSGEGSIAVDTFEPGLEEITLIRPIAGG